MEVKTCEEYVLAKLRELENDDHRKDDQIFSLQQIIYSLQRVFRMGVGQDGHVGVQFDFETVENEKDLRDMLLNIFGMPEINKAPVQQEAQPESPVPVE